MATPYTISTIIDQIGRGIRGGFCYTGASGLSYSYPKEAPRYCEFRPDYRSREDEPTGLVDAPISLSFCVNTSKRCKVIVAYEPDDTYTVWLWKPIKEGLKTGRIGEVLAKVEDVYCETLRQTVERIYDDYIRDHQGGFIKI